MQKKIPSLRLGLLKVLFVVAVCLTLAGLSGITAEAALDRGNFPIKIYINPYVVETKTAESVGELVPESTLQSIRQGVLDYIRLLMTAPQGSDSLFYVFTLRRQVEEKQEAKLLDTGIFVFVERPEQATLLIEGANRPRLNGPGGEGESRIGSFQATSNLQVGHILLALKRNAGERFTEFDLRITLMHELGHALGLEHQAEQKCNFMAPADYSCFTDSLADCTPDNQASRCIGVQLAQVRSVEDQITAEARKDNPGNATGFAAEMQDYTMSIQTRVAEVVSSLPQSRQKGKLALTVLSGGVLKEVSVTQSFGAEADAEIVAQVKKMSPFDRLPLTYTEPNVSFTLSLVPRKLIEDYVQQIQPSVLAQLARLNGLTQVGQIQLQISGKGEIGEVKILASFGSALDQQAVVNLKHLSPLPPIANLDETDSIYATFSYGAQRAPKPVKSKQP